MRRLTLGSIEFDDGESIAADTARGWFFYGLTDWEGLPELRESSSPRPMAHGSFSRDNAWRTQAAPSFTAMYVGDSAEEAAAEMRALNGVCGGSVSLRMSLADDDLILGRDVVVRHIVPAARRGGHRKRAATVYVEADDPLLYGAEVVASTGVPTPGVGISDPVLDPVQEGDAGNLGRVQVVNEGTATTSVRIDVAGGLADGVELRTIETGEILRLERQIPDGSTVTFNSRTGRAQLDGQSDVSGFLTVDQWPQLPAGATRTIQFTPLGTQSGTPTMTVRLSPAYF